MFTNRWLIVQYSGYLYRYEGSSEINVQFSKFGDLVSNFEFIVAFFLYLIMFALNVQAL